MEEEATTETEKIYVALGNNVIDGFNTLAWTLSKWYSHPNISIVILHVKYNTSKYLSTLLGKFPEGIACDVKLETMRKYEQDIIDKLLSKYIAFCDNVPAEILEIEKFDEPIQKRTIDLIYGLGITKLVMGFSFMKASLKPKDAINALFYVHKNKPAFCELFFVCDGKEVLAQEKNDEVIMEEDNGVIVARMKKDKICIKDCLERIFDKTPDSQPRSSFGSISSSANSESPLSQNQWEFHLQEIENYLQELLSLNLDQRSYAEDSDISQIGPLVELFVKDPSSSDNVRDAEKYEILREKLNEAYNIIQMKRKEAQENLERHEKAEWAIWLCNRREEQLESLIKEEVAAREELTKELDANKEQLHQIILEVEESEKRLSSLTEQQSELLNKIQISLLEMSQAESQVEKTMAEREEILRDIEVLRMQRDAVNKRVVFLKQNNDGARMNAKRVVMIDKGCCGFREYREEEIIMATHNFWEQLRLRSGGGGWSNVYRGRINHSTVAIKMLNSVPGLSQVDLLAEVTLVAGIRQPHLVAMLGFCSAPKCIILEYMHNGSLGDILFCKRKSLGLRWQDRVRIATEVCSGLGFLNAAQSKPTIHCHINSSRILLDQNLVAKITVFGLYHGCGEECNSESDVKAIGVLLMHLLTGRRNWKEMDRALSDETNVIWPLDVATEIEDLAMRCMSMDSNRLNEDMMSIARVMEELNEIRRKGDSIV